MKRKFTIIRLSENCRKIGSGATPQGGNGSYKTEGISLIRSQNILDFVFSKTGLAFIDEKQANELANVELEERDVLINITGDSVARVCQVPDEVLPARVNQHVAILRADQQKLNPEFLKYSLLAKPVKDLFLTLASTGATRKALTKGMLEEFKVSVPDLPTQSHIAFILSSLDDKIELNRRMNQTLEQMAQALFNHYFVDNIDPDNLSEGWRNDKLGQVLSFRNGKSSPTRNDSSSFPVYGSNGIIGYCDVANCVAKSFIIGRVGSFCGSVYFTLEKAYVTDNAIIAEPKMKNSSAFCNQLLHSLNLNNFKGGSGQPLVNQSVLSNIDIIVPVVDIIEEYEEIVLEFYQKIFQNEKENKALSTIRDTILPKLMSGEIDVDALLKKEEQRIENFETA